MSRAFPDYICIKFTKRGADGINLYHRKKGEAAFKFWQEIQKALMMMI
jgi:hypothetical protein